ncbi:hypothetical protein FIBSPDRAFT_992127 [Athelia psychrophila]|uniref:Uncharacterized protein n=1 Tax=Athelia psychrophila TaxID=1759441 RepID=A0A166S8X8_9AGAM|nr:hypothetical protein FIBSPDRAFT_992127 [Fibularhizoctonia sp. CBS 109695]
MTNGTERPLNVCLRAHFPWIPGRVTAGDYHEHSSMPQQWSTAASRLVMLALMVLFIERGRERVPSSMVADPVAEVVASERETRSVKGLTMVSGRVGRRGVQEDTTSAAHAIDEGLSGIDDSTCNGEDEPAVQLTGAREIALAVSTSMTGENTGIWQQKGVHARVGADLHFGVSDDDDLRQICGLPPPPAAWIELEVRG